MTAMTKTESSENAPGEFHSESTRRHRPRGSIPARVAVLVPCSLLKSYFSSVFQSPDARSSEIRTFDQAAGFQYVLMDWRLAVYIAPTDAFPSDAYKLPYGLQDLPMDQLIGTRLV